MSVLKLAPNFAQKNEVLYKLAVIFGKTYQLEYAIDYFKKASPEYLGSTSLSRRIDIMIKLGICYLELKQYGEGLKAYESALASDDTSTRVLQHVAWCEHLMGRHQQALEHAVRATVLKDSESEGYYIQGRVYLAAGQLSEAKDAFNKAIARTQNKAVYLASLAHVVFVERLYSEAFEHYLKATQIDPTLPEVWYNIGLLYEIHKQASEAVIAYERAIAIAPNFAEAQSRKRMLDAEEGAQSPIPSPLHPPFAVPDGMVPLKMYANNHRLKKATDPNLPLPIGSTTPAASNVAVTAILIVRRNLILLTTSV